MSIIYFHHFQPLPPLRLNQQVPFPRTRLWFRQQRPWGRLQPEFRQAVELVDLQDLSYQDAASQLSCPVGTVMSRLHRGRKRLRKVLHPYAATQGILPSAA